MKYTIDISDSYRCCIDFDCLSGIKSFSSLPEIDKKTSMCRMHLENIAVNMDESIWRNQILSVNPKSIINIHDDLIILAQKAVLIIENMRCYDLIVIHNEHNYYYSSGLKFNLKDRLIVFGGYDTEHTDAHIYGRAIFNGKVFLELEEDKIQPLVIGYDDQIGGFKNITKINNKKELEVMKKNKLLDISAFNNIESPIWDFDFIMDHFFFHDDGYSEAIKRYYPTDK